MARKSRFTGDVRENTRAAMFLAGVYARLSIEDNDDEEQNSIGNQKKIAQDFLKDKADITVVDYYADNGFTGMNYNRPDFQRMMNDLRAGKINCVIVKDISRLGRHFVMTSEFVEKVFPMMGIRLICISDDYDSISEKSDAQALLLPFKMVMNDSYVKDISKKIRSSISAKMDSGEYLPSASSIPYGYIRNPEKNTFDVDAETAPVVVRIFKMKAQGMALNAIAKTLNEEGIPCPGRLRYMRGITKAAKYENAMWLHGTLRKMLLDPVYLGHRVHGKVKRDKLGMDKTSRPADEWQIIENAHEAIVTQELYDKAQAALHAVTKKRSQFTEQDAPETDHREVLKGKVHCGDCGSLMRATKSMGRADENGKRKAHISYECGRYLDSGRMVCSIHYVRESEIMTTLKNALDQQMQTVVDYEALLKEIQSMPKVVKYQSNMSNQLSSIQTKRRNLEQRQEQLLVDLTDGLIDMQEYAYAKKRYGDAYERLLEEENKACASSNALKTIVSSTNQWVKAVKEACRLPEINRKVVDYLVKQINVYPDNRIQIVLNYQDPYHLLAEYLEQIPEVNENVS